MVKYSPGNATLPMQVLSLGQEDLLEGGMATSCLENVMDRGAWRATAHGVAQSWTRLKQQHAYTMQQGGCG